MLSYQSSRYQPVALPPERGSQRLHARRPRSCAFPPAPRGGESESSAPTVAALRSSGDIIASGLPLNVHPGLPSRSDRARRPRARIRPRRARKWPGPGTTCRFLGTVVELHWVRVSIVRLKPVLGVVLSALSDSGSSHTLINGPRGYSTLFVWALGKQAMLAGHGEWAMAEARKGSALGNLSYTHVPRSPTPSQTRLRRPQGQRSCDSSELLPLVSFHRQ